MPDRLPSGRWRARIRNPKTKQQIPAHKVIGGPATFDSERQAWAAEDQAAKVLGTKERIGVTVEEWWTDWTTDPLWERPAEGTNIHNRERTKHFVLAYGTRSMESIGAQDVAQYLKGGKNLTTVPALRAMFNDARRPQAGQLITGNPFANLGLRKSKGRKNIQPPNEGKIWEMIAAADEYTPPSFAAYLVTACFSAMRPGELDALPVTALNFTPGAEEIDVMQKWNATTRKIDPYTKHRTDDERRRSIAMTAPVRERLLELPRESEFVFTTLRGTHYTPSSRIHHWNRVRTAVGLGNTDLYTATRHFFGWYALNVLGLEAHVIALQFGHTDGGQLVRELYGHPDAALAREATRNGFADVRRVEQLKRRKAA